MLTKKNLAIYLIIAMHFFGFVFMQFPQTKPLFLALTPLNLIVSGGFLLYYHSQKSKLFYIFVGIAFLVGYWIEVIGTKTGIIFGQYWYGKTLGLKVLDVPLLIGVNWAVLVVATGYISEKICSFITQKSISIALKFILGAILMTGLDFLIEPIAIHLDFWQWQNNHIPTQNFVAWFIVALLLHFLYAQLKIEKRNDIAIPLYFSQIMFFGLYNVALM